MSAETALAASIRAAAIENSNVQALIADRFYDEPPPDLTFPYVTIGRFESKPIDASDREALEHGVTLHVWSRYGGRAEALEVIGALRGCLHNAALNVSASVSGAGVFKDANSDALMQQAFFTQAAASFQLVIPDFGTLSGPFIVEALDYSGDHDGEAAFAVTLASAGALSFAAL